MNDTIHHIDQNRRVTEIPRPDWANDPKKMLSKKDVEELDRTEWSVPPHLKFEGNALEVDVVTRGDGDIIYQFLNVTHKDFKQLLADVVEDHFGSTDVFKVDYVTELKTWGLLAKGVRLNPMFNPNFYTEDFLWLLDGVLVESMKE